MNENGGGQPANISTGLFDGIGAGHRHSVGEQGFDIQAIRTALHGQQNYCLNWLVDSQARVWLSQLSPKLFSSKYSAEDCIPEAGQGFAESRLAVQNVSGGVFSFGFGAWKLERLLKSPRRLGVPRSFAEVRVLTQIVSWSPLGT